ncbi:hypothetical protein ACLX1H_004544 [Fusarium chlamydosporum]
MKLASYTIAITTFIVRVLAQTADFDRIITPANLQSVPAGESFKISWETPAKYSDEKISISLIGGPTQGTQQPIKTIATAGIDNDEEFYNWAVDSDLGGEQVYGLVFRSESNSTVFQYSFPFKIARKTTEMGTSARSYIRNRRSTCFHTTVDGAAQTQPPTRPITVLTPATGKPSILATPVPHITSEATSIGYSVLLFSGLIIALLNV